MKKFFFGLFYLFLSSTLIVAEQDKAPTIFFLSLINQDQLPVIYKQEKHKDYETRIDIHKQYEIIFKSLLPDSSTFKVMHCFLDPNEKKIHAEGPILLDAIKSLRDLFSTQADNPRRNLLKLNKDKLEALKDSLIGQIHEYGKQDKLLFILLLYGHGIQLKGPESAWRFQNIPELDDLYIKSLVEGIAENEAPKNTKIQSLILLESCYANSPRYGFKEDIKCLLQNPDIMYLFRGFPEKGKNQLKVDPRWSLEYLHRTYDFFSTQEDTFCPLSEILLGDLEEDNFGFNVQNTTSTKSPKQKAKEGLNAYRINKKRFSNLSVNFDFIPLLMKRPYINFGWDKLFRARLQEYLEAGNFNKECLKLIGIISKKTIKEAIYNHSKSENPLNKTWLELVYFDKNVFLKGQTPAIKTLLSFAWEFLWFFLLILCLVAIIFIFKIILWKNKKLEAFLYFLFKWRGKKEFRRSCTNQSLIDLPADNYQDLSKSFKRYLLLDSENDLLSDVYFKFDPEYSHFQLALSHFYIKNNHQNLKKEGNKTLRNTILENLYKYYFTDADSMNERLRSEFFSLLETIYRKEFLDTSQSQQLSDWLKEKTKKSKKSTQIDLDNFYTLVFLKIILARDWHTDPSVKDYIDLLREYKIDNLDPAQTLTEQEKQAEKISLKSQLADNENNPETGIEAAYLAWKYASRYNLKLKNDYLRRLIKLFVNYLALSLPLNNKCTNDSSQLLQKFKEEIQKLLIKGPKIQANRFTVSLLFLKRAACFLKLGPLEKQTTATRKKHGLSAKQDKLISEMEIYHKLLIDSPENTRIDMVLKDLKHRWKKTSNEDNHKIILSRALYMALLLHNQNKEITEKLKQGAWKDGISLLSHGHLFAALELGREPSSEKTQLIEADHPDLHKALLQLNKECAQTLRDFSETEKTKIDQMVEDQYQHDSKDN